MSPNLSWLSAVIKTFSRPCRLRFKKDVHARMEERIEEEKAYCNKGKDAGIASISDCFSVGDIKTDVMRWMKNSAVPCADICPDTTI